MSFERIGVELLVTRETHTRIVTGWDANDAQGCGSGRRRTCDLGSARPAAIE
jgi:hypothetical protein